MLVRLRDIKNLGESQWTLASGLHIYYPTINVEARYRIGSQEGVIQSMTRKTSPVMMIVPEPIPLKVWSELKEGIIGALIGFLFSILFPGAAEGIRALFIGTLKALTTAISTGPTPVP